MTTILRMTDPDGRFANFEGAGGRGTLSCSDILPLSIAWHVNGRLLGEIVAIDNPAGKWLERATIVGADASPAGTRFELTY